MSSAGQGSFSMSNKNEQTVIPPPGPPFDPTSADNGVSVDPGSGRIVLGNNSGGTQAQLLNNREILMNSASLTYLEGQVLNFTSLGGLIGAYTNSDLVNGYVSGIPATLQVNHGGSNFGLAVTRATSDSSGANFTLYKTRGAGFASVVGALVDEDIMGNILWQGVSVNLTQRTTAQITARAVTVNGTGLWGVGAVPVGSVASFIDLINTNLAGVNKNRIRIFPNGETCIVDTTVGGVVPRVDGIALQVYGTALIQTSLVIGAAANNTALSVLELTSTTAGFLPARMTAAQGTALAVGAAQDGLQIHVTTVNATFPAVGPYWWNNALGAWVAM